MKIEVRELRAGYGAKLVLDGMSLEIPAHGVVTLLGPNGCGKSTLLKVIGRILSPRSGDVLLDGRAVSQYDTGELARRMAILPQLHRASGELTVEELVSYGRFPHRRKYHWSGKRDREAIGRALRMTRMEALRGRGMSTLSGGERQRAWIAMTLAQEPELLLLDEPTTFLDVCCQFEIIEMIRELNREFGITVVMVLHDLNLAVRCSDHLIMLRDRSIRYAGTPAELMKPEILCDIFEIRAEFFTGKDGLPYCMPTASARKDSK